jgi:hypothetical protein
MLGLALAALLLGCEDKAKIGGERASGLIDHLIPLVERDAKQVRDGIPEGAKKIAPLLEDQPGGDLATLQRAIQKSRAGVQNLAFAKSSFFVFVDPQGTVLRSESDPDLAAGGSLYKDIPEMKKLEDPSATVVEAFGKMHGLRGVQNGQDMQWVVGAPVSNAAGKRLGSFVTGWSLRSYANYLEEDARRFLEKGQGDQIKAAPLVYVFLVRGSEAFGAPVTPDVNADAIGKLDVVTKANAGIFQTKLDIEGRAFVLVAKPCPPLGSEVALAVLYSAT